MCSIYFVHTSEHLIGEKFNFLQNSLNYERKMKLFEAKLSSLEARMPSPSNYPEVKLRTYEDRKRILGKASERNKAKCLADAAVSPCHFFIDGV